mmetsp:Transcript_32021/g.52891  ORF Transcript_32021/g.52891 Transcript_32021/m.52891 type:complete len:101 (-) Transcript_32021:300-602(-)
MEGDYTGELMILPLTLATAGMIVLGRSSSCEVTLARDDQISRRHVQLESKDNKLYLRDLGSTYGTRLNGKAINTEAAAMRPGDVIGLGSSSFRLQLVPAH